MRRFLLAGLVLVVGAAAARSDDGKVLAPFLDERTVVVMRLDLAKAEPAKLVGRLAKAANVKATSPAETTKEWLSLAEGLVKDGAGVLYLVFSLADVPDEYPLLVVPLGKDADAGRLTRRLGALKQYDASLGVTRVGEALVVSSAAAFKRLQTRKPVARPDIAAALGKEPPFARLAIVQTTDARRVLEETLPTLPEELGGGSIKPLSRGLRWLTLDVVAAPALAIRVTVQAADADAARALDDLAARALRLLADSKDVIAAVPEVAKLAALWKPKRDGDRLVLTIDEKDLANMLRPYLERLVVTERQARAAAQMRRLLLAIHDYESRHGMFPAHASYDKAGKPLLSWRVHCLPSLGEEKLHKEFKLDEPWDSAHNKKLLAKMPDVYRPRSDKLAGQQRTTFLAPVGEETMFPPRRGIRVAEIADGTTHTIMLADAGDEQAVEWTRPKDLEIEEKDPGKGLSRRYSEQLLVGMADGTVRFLPGTIAPATLWWLFTRSGGEVVTLP